MELRDADELAGGRKEEYHQDFLEEVVERAVTPSNHNDPLSWKVVIEVGNDLKSNFGLARTRWSHHDSQPMVHSRPDTFYLWASESKGGEE
jgi:hypothetical protein